MNDDELPLDFSGTSETEAPDAPLTGNVVQVQPSDALPERDPYDVAMERVAAIKAEVAQLRNERDTATNRMQKLQEEEADLLRRFSVSNEHNHIDNQRAIMAHLQRQHEVRMARAGRHQQAVASGLSPEDLRGKSALDAAMSRKTNRGTHRPTVS